jgi:hypothetical protein
MQYKSLLLLSTLLFINPFKKENNPDKKKAVVVWQPSHQTDTGVNFNEAKTCNSIAEAAMSIKSKAKEYKVWSLDKENLHHNNTGTNTLKAHTSDVIDGKISGYAYEINESNKLNPDVFIALHNNGGTKRHAIWGFIHEGDEYEKDNKELAGRLIAAVSAATDLENRGVLFDSSTGRNDYRCASTGKLGFYSIDETVNKAKFRVLLEIGDIGASKAFLENPENQKTIGIAIKKELLKWLAEKNML